MSPAAGFMVGETVLPASPSYGIEACLIIRGA
jgi:hypothetical protein